jgi:hypothetical protein
MKEFKANNEEILGLVREWESKLSELPEDIITKRQNEQKRSIKQIVGHMVDSATNNIHRIIHLQYQPNPLIYPDYANKGNNDRWIVIQNYQEENWNDLIQLWKYSNIHIVHVINHVKVEKLDNEWINGLKQKVRLKAMILDYLRHFKLHLGEIDELIGQVR